MLLKLLQLSSSALPLGAYSYSEGLETAIEQQMIQGEDGLQHWLLQDLSHGAIRLEAALMLRGYRGWVEGDLDGLQGWNQWGSAVKESAELREQSWQMGNTLIRLLRALDSDPNLEAGMSAVGKPCNSAIAFGLAAAHWQIDEFSATLGYLHSWATNLINAGVKLIPLGQTTGQQLLFNLHPTLETTAKTVLPLKDDELYSCSWGLGLASLQHETQYTRLFRS